MKVLAIYLQRHFPVDFLQFQVSKSLLIIRFPGRHPFYLQTVQNPEMVGSEQTKMIDLVDPVISQCHSVIGISGIDLTSSLC